MRLGVLAPLFCALAALTGCFEVEREVEVLPDGSGRVSMRLRVPEALRRLDSRLPERIRQGAAQVEGVRWRAPVEERGATVLVGYFSDLRAVRGHGITHRLDLAEDGGLRLVVVRGDPAGGKSPMDQVPQDLLEGRLARLLVSRMFAGLSVTERVVLPAPLRVAPEGRYARRTEGNPRAAETRVRGRDLGDLDGLRAALAEVAREPATFECEPPAPGGQAALAAEVQAALAELFPAPEKE